MRRFSLAVATSLLALVACQDGPNQTYAPPATNAAWNNGRLTADGGVTVVPDAVAQGDGGSTWGWGSVAPFAQSDGGAIGSGGNNANEICTPDQVAQTYITLNSAPIVPPNSIADLNIEGWACQGGAAFCGSDAGTSFKGMTIEQAEAVDCQGTAVSDLFGQNGYLSVVWGGGSGSVVAEYYVATHKLTYVGVGPGLFGGAYSGKAVFCTQPAPGAPPETACSSPTPGNITYTIAVDGQTEVDIATTDSNGNTSHANSDFDWNNAAAGQPAAIAVFDSMFRAAMATYLPTFPAEPQGQVCLSTGLCQIYLFNGGYAAFFVTPLNWGIWVNPDTLHSVSANAINRLDTYPAQLMNFSSANPVLNLSPAGAGTLPVPLGGPGPCTLGFGLDYRDFFNNCINVSPSATANTSEQNELYSSFSHDHETFNFNIVGVDMSFADNRLSPTQPVVDPPVSTTCVGSGAEDPACPQTGDYGIELNVDQSTLGFIANDWSYAPNSAGTLVAQHQTLAGAGAMYDDYRQIAVSTLQSEVCPAGALSSNPTCQVWFPPANDAGVAPPPMTPAQLTAMCIGPRDPNTGLLDPAVQPIGAAFQSGSPAGLPTGCTGMEQLLSADITQDPNGGTNYNDPVNIGPIVTFINPQYSLGLKMGHQQATWCYDAMTINQIAAQSAIIDQTTGNPAAALTAQDIVTLGSYGPNGIVPFIVSKGLDPTKDTVALTLPRYCVSGYILPTSQAQVVAQLVNGNDALLPIDVQGITGTGGPASPRFFFKAYGQALVQMLEAATGQTGQISMPVAKWGPPTDVFGTCAVNQDCGGAGVCVGATAGVPQSGLCAPNMPIQPDDLYFDSSGDGQFENMEYVDRRFVCPDGANDCAPQTCPNGAAICNSTVPQSGFVCPPNTCTVGTPGCTIVAPGQQVSIGGTLTPTCNPNEAAQPPTDVTFTADVRDGIMDAYDIWRFMKRGETALYNTIQPPGFAPAQASNALLSNVFGSPLLNSIGPATAFPELGPLVGAPAGPPAVDLSGNTLHGAHYLGAFNGTPMTLSYSKQPNWPVSLAQTFPSGFQAQFGYPNIQAQGQADVVWKDSSGNENPDGGCATNADCTVATPGTACLGGLCYPTLDATIDWIPQQPLNGFDQANPSASALDEFVQTASVDFTGITTTGLIDFNVFLPPLPGTSQAIPEQNPFASDATQGANGQSTLLLEAQAVESSNFLGDVFMCYEPAFSPPLLAVRMYTPTLAVLNWLNQLPRQYGNPYTDCGIVVRWSPYDNYVNLIESTTYGVRLQVTQGGGLGRIVGAQVHVPGLSVEN